MANKARTRNAPQPGADFNGLSRQHLIAIVDLMAQRDPDQILNQFTASDASPVSDGDVLRPDKVNSVVHMAKFINIALASDAGHLNRSLKGISAGERARKGDVLSHDTALTVAAEIEKAPLQTGSGESKSLCLT